MTYLISVLIAAIIALFFMVAGAIIVSSFVGLVVLCCKLYVKFR